MVELIFEKKLIFQDYPLFHFLKWNCVIFLHNIIPLVILHIKALK